MGGAFVEGEVGGGAGVMVLFLGEGAGVMVILGLGRSGEGAGVVSVLEASGEGVKRRGRRDGEGGYGEEEEGKREEGGGEVHRFRVRWRLRYILTIILTRIEYKFDFRRTTSNHKERAVIAFFGIPCKSVILAVDCIAKQHP